MFWLLGATVFESNQRKLKKRIREINIDSSNVDGYLGPWGKYADEKTVMKPSEVSDDENVLSYFQHVCLQFEKLR